MSLYTAEKKFFQQLKQAAEKNPAKPLAEMTVLEFQASGDGFSQYAGKPADIEFVNETIPSPEGHQIPIRIYNPQLSNAPCLILFPGNGFILDIFELNHVPASIIAKYSGYKVIVVNFRLVPQHPFPAGLNDAISATNYIVQQSQTFAIDKTKIVIAGFSSGANFAALTTNTFCNNHEVIIFHQLLVGGLFDLTDSLNSHQAYESQDEMLTKEVKAFLAKAYVPAEMSAQDPKISPYWENDLSGLPPTTIVVAEYDGLRSQSEAYAEKLLQAGNQVTKLVLNGQTHNTMVFRSVLSEGEDPALVIARRLKALL